MFLKITFKAEKKKYLLSNKKIKECKKLNPLFWKALKGYNVGYT